MEGEGDTAGQGDGSKEVDGELRLAGPRQGQGNEDPGCHEPQAHRDHEPLKGHRKAGRVEGVNGEERETNTGRDHTHRRVEAGDESQQGHHVARSRPPMFFG